MSAWLPKASPLFRICTPFTTSSSSTSFSRQASTYVHLGDLQPSKGSTKQHIRLGRGQGSTKGGTSGRGHKGQRARSGNGKPGPGFEGGQTPITRLFPKRGFVNYTEKTYAPVSLSTIQAQIATSRLDPTRPITINTLISSNAVHGISGYGGIKLLGDVDPTLPPLPPLSLTLSRFSKTAAKAVIDAGGEVTAVYHNALSLRREIMPHKFLGKEIRLAQPIKKTDIEYYSNPKKHGYLAKEGLVSAESQS